MAYSINSKKANRRVRRKFDEISQLSIVSLVDVLTILLVFLIKNVSMEAQKLTVPDNMNFPTIMKQRDLLSNKGTTVIKVFPDMIKIGDEDLYFGKPEDLLNDPGKRTEILKYLQTTAQSILEKRDANGKPMNLETALLIQADRSILCEYITTLVDIGTSSYYQYIYFANLLDKDWLEKSKPSSNG
jgi:hypothetical protein